MKKEIHFSNSSKQMLLHLIFLLCLLSCSKKSNNNNNPGGNPNDFDAEVSILGSQNNQVIEGFGCATVFAPANTTPISNDEFDRLFGSGSNQVGLSILRIRVASDDSWRLVELNNAKSAIQRGARVMATPWSPPASMKTNHSINGGGSLIPDSSAAYAKYLNDFANYMSANGAALYAISIQNEPDFTATYEGCEWSANQMRDFLKNYAQNISSTKIIAPESFNNNQTYVNTILSDDAAASHVDIVGGHLYGGGLVENQLAKSKSKEVWMTEHLDTLTTYAANLNTAIEIHDCLTKANFNAYVWWYGKRFYGPIGQDGQVTKRGFMISQFARFIRQGSIRLGTSSNSRADVFISAYKNGTKKIVVAINSASSDVKQKINFQDASATSIVPYVTTTTKNVEQGTAITVTNNTFTYTIPAQSVVTFVEQ